jgi:hypothetical protein
MEETLVVMTHGIRWKMIMLEAGSSATCGTTPLYTVTMRYIKFIERTMQLHKLGFAYSTVEIE